MENELNNRNEVPEIIMCPVIDSLLESILYEEDSPSKGD